MLWRSMNTRSGIDLQYLITKSNVNGIVHGIEDYYQINKSSHYLRLIQLIVKFLYLINSFIQFILIHIDGFMVLIYGIIYS